MSLWLCATLDWETDFSKRASMSFAASPPAPLSLIRVGSEHSAPLRAVLRRQAGRHHRRAFANVSFPSRGSLLPFQRVTASNVDQAVDQKIAAGSFGSRGAHRLANFVATKLTLSWDAVKLPFTCTGSRPQAVTHAAEKSRPQ